MYTDQTIFPCVRGMCVAVRAGPWMLKSYIPSPKKRNRSTCAKAVGCNATFTDGQGPRRLLKVSALITHDRDLPRSQAARTLW